VRVANPCRAMLDRRLIERGETTAPEYAARAFTWDENDEELTQAAFRREEAGTLPCPFLAPRRA
jgi:hypothetical protein